MPLLDRDRGERFVASNAGREFGDAVSLLSESRRYPDAFAPGTGIGAAGV